MPLNERFSPFFTLRFYMKETCGKKNKTKQNIKFHPKCLKQKFLSAFNFLNTKSLNTWAELVPYYKGYGTRISKKFLTPTYFTSDLSLYIKNDSLVCISSHVSFLIKSYFGSMTTSIMSHT